MTILDSLSASQRAELASVIGLHGAIAEFATRHDLNANSLRGALSRAGGLAGLQPDEPIEVPAPVVQEPQPARKQASDVLKTIAQCPQPLTLVSLPEELHLDRWLYCSDIHAPLHDPVWIERLMRVGYHLAVRDLVIGGDFFDFAELSAHGDDIEAPGINAALELAGDVLRYIKSGFDRVHILPGNHCRRMARRLNKNLSFRNLAKMAIGDMSGISTTENDYFLVNRRWTVGHPRFFASFPAKGLEQVAVQRKRSVIGAHSHTLGLIRHGEWLCVSPGHLMRTDLVPYLVRSDGMSKHPDQHHSQGFVLIEQDGSRDIVTLFGQGITRWSDYE